MFQQHHQPEFDQGLRVRFRFRFRVRVRVRVRARIRVRVRVRVRIRITGSGLGLPQSKHPHLYPARGAAGVMVVYEFGVRANVEALGHCTVLTRVGEFSN